MADSEEEYVIEWTATAEIQFYEVLDFWIIKTKSTTFSEKLANLTWHKIEFIRKNPLSSKALKNNSRIAITGHFSLIYKIINQKIIIISFWDNRQNPKKLLEILKEKIN